MPHSTLPYDFPRAKSFLFVSASKIENFESAFQSGAEAIIFDLEDSVTPEQKPTGRKNILSFSKANPNKKLRPRRLASSNSPPRLRKLSIT